MRHHPNPPPLFRRGLLVMPMGDFQVIRDTLPERSTCYVMIRQDGRLSGPLFVWDGYRLTPASAQPYGVGALPKVDPPTIAAAESELIELESDVRTLSTALAVTLGRDARVLGDAAWTCEAGVESDVEAPSLEFYARVRVRDALAALRPLVDARPSEVLAALRGCEVSP